MAKQSTTPPSASAKAADVNVDALVEARLSEILGTKAAPLREAPRAPIDHVALRTHAFGPADPVGNIAFELASAFKADGLGVSLLGKPAVCGAVDEELLTLHTPPASASLLLGPLSGWPPQRDPRAIGLCVLEADDLPLSWTPALSFVRHIVVPSEANAEAVRKHASDATVHVVHLGVNAQTYTARKRERGAVLRILFDAAYAGDVRNGADLAMAAFTAAFPERDDVELVVRSAYPHDLRRSDPRVRFQIARLTPAERNEAFGAFDALLYPSRGDGFGATPLEAMATGMPAIFADAGGMHEYAGLGLPVSARPIPALMDDTFTARWREPALDELVDRLRELDTHYDALQNDAMLDAEEIASSWAWGHTARALRAIFNA